MPTHIYIKDEVRILEGFTEDTERKHQFFYRGIRLKTDDDGRLYVYPTASKVPPALKDFVEEATMMNDFPAEPHRTAGRYEHKGAVMFVDADPKRGHKIFARGPVLDDLVDLYLKIRAGTIQPKESWEGEQVKALPTDGLRA